MSLPVSFNLCETHFSLVSRGSPYLPIAIVRIRILFEASTHSYEQSAISLTAFGEFLPRGMPRDFRIMFNRLL